MKKLNLKLGFLILLSASLTACAGIPKFHPHKLDTQLMELRKYEIVDYENATIGNRPTAIIPITPGTEVYKGGMWCVPNKEAIELKAWYLKNKKSSSDNH